MVARLDMHHGTGTTQVRTLWLGCAAMLALAGCTELKTVSEDEIEDAGVDITIPDAGDEDAADEDAGDEDAAQDAGEDAAQDAGGDASFPSDELCVLPPIPPRLPAVSFQEKTCSTSEESWPDCLPNSCDATTFVDACRQYCEMSCERERWFCSGTRCELPDDPDQTYCDTEAAMRECVDLCAGDASCLNALCVTDWTSTCGDFTCPEGEGSNCAGLSCDHTCEFSFDGECDDGSLINASFDECASGSDCADCGARAACFDVGAECFSPVQCCGFETEDTYCVDVGTEDQPLGRCLEDCTGREGEVDTENGLECVSLTGGGAAWFPTCALD